MRSAPITCIVLNWNGGRDTLHCVSSLVASQGVSLSILIVDNGSSDGSDSLIKSEFPNVTMIRNPRNFGVAKAWNIAVRWALERASECVFFLNSDAEVDKDCVATLQQTMLAASEVGIVSPRIIDGKESGRIWFDGGIVNMFGDTVHRSFLEAPGLRAESILEDFASGCAMLVRASVFGRVGFFDESYFAYSEDADLCLRARAGGFTIVHSPKAVVIHYPSTSTIRNRGKWFRDYYVTRNRLLLVRKRLRGMRWLLFLFYFALKHVAIPVTYYVLTAQFRRVGAVVTGVWDFNGNRFGERYS